MTGYLKRTLTAALGAAAMAAALAGTPAAAQTAACPCMDAARFDQAIKKLALLTDREGVKVNCATSRNLATFSLIQARTTGVETVNADGSVAVQEKRDIVRSILFDLMRGTSTEPHTCRLEVVNKGEVLKSVDTALRPAQAKACVEELRASRAWAVLGCR